MNLVSIVLVLTAACVHATWNLIAKKAAGGARFVLLYSMATAVIYFPVLMLKTPDFTGVIRAETVPYFFGSALLHLGYALALQYGYQRAGLSVVYPTARGTGPIFSMAGAFFFAGETICPGHLLGGALVVSGLLWIGLAGRGGGIQRESMRSGLAWGTGTGLFIAGYTVVDGLAVKRAQVDPFALDYMSNLLRILLLLPLMKRNRAIEGLRSRPLLMMALLVGTLSPLSYVLVLYAMRLAPISVIGPTREVSMMIGLFFGWWFLNEPGIGKKLPGVLAMVAGVLLLTK